MAIDIACNIVVPVAIVNGYANHLVAKYSYNLHSYSWLSCYRYSVSR